MRRMHIFGLFLALFALTMVGCGDDSSGGGGTTVTGTAAKGTITGATVKVFQIISSQNPAKARVNTATQTPIGTGTTAADGSYNINIGSVVTKGGLMVEVSPGTGTPTYVEEAANTTKPYTSTLRAAFGNISGAVKRGEQVVINVTPYTELGVEAISGAPTDAAIAIANAKVKSTFGSILGGLDILTTKPYNANTTPPAGATNFQTNYALALATISQFIVDGTPLAQLGTQFLPDVQAGTLSPANSNALLSNYSKFISSANNKTGVANPITMTVTASKTTVSVGGVDKATLTANVKFGGAAVAAGSVVSFTIKSGTGVLSAATAATDASGNAAVTLASNAAGTVGPVVVTATVFGNIIADAPPVTIADPNAPATVTLAKNPANGISGSQGPVTLTATVKNPAGGNVPDGTVVTFATTGGTLSATTATTSAGTASVTLNSATPGTFSVTATAKATNSTVQVTSQALSVAFLDATAPAAVTLTANPTTGVTNNQGPVTLTANVTRLAPAGTPVPIGTTVTFAITAGTGTLSATTATTDASGNASVTLNSTTVNTVSVQATAGAIGSAIVPVPFINQLTQAVVTIQATGDLGANKIGAWDTDLGFPSTVTIKTAAGQLDPTAFSLSAAAAAVPGANAVTSSNPADATHTTSFVNVQYTAGATQGITGTSPITLATLTFDLVTPTATPTIVLADFIPFITNVSSAAVGAPSLKPGVDLTFTLTFK